jgi:hypothetical protein
MFSHALYNLYNCIWDNFIFALRENRLIVTCIENLYGMIARFRTTVRLLQSLARQFLLSWRRRIVQEDAFWGTQDGFEVYPPGGTAVAWDCGYPGKGLGKEMAGRDCCVQNSHFASALHASLSQATLQGHWVQRGQGGECSWVAMMINPRTDPTQKLN